MPKNKDYFLDPDFGLFEIKPEKAYFSGNVPIYIYDVRNQNPIEPEIFDELFKWATLQGLYKIRRVDVNHAIRLRHKDLSNLTEEVSREKKEIRSMVNKVQESVTEKNNNTKSQMENEQGTPGSEYSIIDEEETQYIITNNLFKHGYIDASQKSILDHKLKTKEINKLDDLLHEIDSFTDVHVSQPIKMEFERILDDYHTYKPRDVIGLISSVSKITKGLKNLRTKPIVNWFPATYLLFGALGIGIVIMLYMTYGTQTPALPTP